jgi:soluble lytic murein transglycosylase-like protein
MGFTYVADKEQLDHSLRPYKRYQRFVLAGAREHGFPPDYIDAIAGVESTNDPDAERRARYESILVPIEKAPRAWTAEF